MNKSNTSKINRFILVGSNLVIVMLSFSFLGCTDDSQKVVNLNTLVMKDEFDTQGAPNTTLWNYNIGTGQNGWGNSELQYYTDRSKNATVQNGYLVVTAHKESFNGSSYTSARLLTKGKFDQHNIVFEISEKELNGRTWFYMIQALYDETDVLVKIERFARLRKYEND